jgi:hypothetical protein
LPSCKRLSIGKIQGFTGWIHPDPAIEPRKIATASVTVKTSANRDRLPILVTDLLSEGKENVATYEGIYPRPEELSQGVTPYIVGVKDMNEYRVIG